MLSHRLTQINADLDEWVRALDSAAADEVPSNVLRLRDHRRDLEPLSEPDMDRLMAAAIRALDAAGHALAEYPDLDEKQVLIAAVHGALDHDTDVDLDVAAFIVCCQRGWLVQNAGRWTVTNLGWWALAQQSAEPQAMAA